MARRSGAWLRCGLLLAVGALVLYVLGPALLSRLKMSLTMERSEGVCEQCVCRCPRPQSVLKIAPGLVNLSITDCGKHDPEMKKEMEKQFVDLVSEELKLHAEVSEESNRHMTRTLGEAKRVATGYRREAEKCIAATETCKEARERSEAFLLKENKLTTLWECHTRWTQSLNINVPTTVTLQRA